MFMTNIMILIKSSFGLEFRGIIWLLVEKKNIFFFNEC